MSELKPCPFCGGDVHWKDGSIYCETCNLSFRSHFDHQQNEEAWNRRAVVVDAADASWNRRAE